MQPPDDRRSRPSLNHQYGFPADVTSTTYLGHPSYPINYSRENIQQACPNEYYYAEKYTSDRRQQYPIIPHLLKTKILSQHEVEQVQTTSTLHPHDTMVNQFQGQSSSISKENSVMSPIHHNERSSIGEMEIPSLPIFPMPYPKQHQLHNSLSSHGISSMELKRHIPNSETARNPVGEVQTVDKSLSHKMSTSESNIILSENVNKEETQNILKVSAYKASADSLSLKKCMVDGSTQTINEFVSTDQTFSKSKSCQDAGVQVSVDHIDSECQTSAPSDIPSVGTESTSPSNHTLHGNEDTTFPVDGPSDGNVEVSPSLSTKTRLRVVLKRLNVPEIDFSSPYVENDDDDDDYDDDDAVMSEEWQYKPSSPRKKTRLTRLRKKIKPTKNNLGFRKPFKCQYCHKRFIKQSSLDNHDLYHCTKKARRLAARLKPKPKETEELKALRQRKPFKCPFCHKRFIKDSSLKCHKLNSCTKKKRRNDFICTECGDHFTMFSHYKKHVSTHNSQLYKCICGQHFQSEYNLTYHIQTVDDGLNHGEEIKNVIETEEKRALCIRKPYKCPFCHKRFIKDSSLENHTLNSCTKNRRGTDFICPECGDHFALFSVYKKHLKLHRGEFYKCTCGEKFVNYCNLKSHTETQHPEDGVVHEEVHPYACKICQKTFIHQGRYKRHMITHENNSRIACSQCGKEYEKSYMEIHERTHSGVKPFVCDFQDCNQAFKSKKLLQRHQRVHEDKYQLPCIHCDKVFTQPSRLKDHLRVHTGEKPYICEICGYGFSRTNHLNRHKLVHAKQELLKEREMLREQELVSKGEYQNKPEYINRHETAVQHRQDFPDRSQFSNRHIPHSFSSRHDFPNKHEYSDRQGFSSKPEFPNRQEFSEKEEFNNKPEIYPLDSVRQLFIL